MPFRAQVPSPGLARYAIVLVVACVVVSASADRASTGPAVDDACRRGRASGNNSGSLIGVCVLALFLWVVPPCTAACAGKRGAGCWRVVQYAGVGVVGLALWSTAVGVFFGHVYNDVATRASTAPVTYRVTARSWNPFDCCLQDECVCQVSGDPPGCSGVAESNTNRTCTLGEACCRQQAYSCNCYTSTRSNGKYGTRTTRYCRTCYRCVTAGFDICRNTCGTCTRPQAVLRHVFEGTVYERTVALECKQSHACIDAFASRYPLGVALDAFVDLDDPACLYHDMPQLNMPAVLVTAGFGAAALLLWLASCVTACRENPEADDDDDAAAAPRAVLHRTTAPAAATPAASPAPTDVHAVATPAAPGDGGRAGTTEPPPEEQPPLPGVVAAEAH